MSLSAEDLAALERRATELGYAFDDPATIAKRLASWAKANLGERVSSALWITAKRERDEGIFIEVRELTLAKRLEVRLGGLLGEWSAGLGATTDLATLDNGVTVAVGAGAVVRYDNLRDVVPVAVVSLRF